jgi:hypothetical protein
MSDSGKESVGQLRSPASMRIATLLLPVVSVLLFVAFAEAGLRLYHFFRHDLSLVDGQPGAGTTQKLSPILLDAKLGWRAAENFRFSGTTASADGSRYALSVSQDSKGFRAYGDVRNGKRKFLVLGDSFTQAIAASDDRTYFAILKKALDVEVFAYGAGGYGSLQEYMILDMYVDVIRPDVILWQLTTNDLINNSSDLEATSRLNNNGLVRPYWRSGRIEYVLPVADSRRTRLLALRYCRLCYMVINRLDRLRATGDVRTVEQETFEGGPARQMFEQSLATTSAVMKLFKKRAGSIPVYAFVAGTGPSVGAEYADGLIAVCLENGIDVLTNVESRVLAAEKSGAVVRAEDKTHWNETGHKIVGDAIVDAMREAM